MRAVSLLYHDVIDACQPESTGFSELDANAYKISRADFEQHLSLLASTMPRPPTTITDLDTPSSQDVPWLLTFDDGGVSAITTIAPCLEHHEWQGHFFVTTDHIGSEPFLSAQQIADLDGRGHIIGTHSCSHPHPMSACSFDRLQDEWQRSCARLAEIVDHPIICGSIPGGAYSRQVAVAAARAGLKALFTSEPLDTCWNVDGCRVFGRYFYRGNTSPRTMLKYALRDKWTCRRAHFLWTCTKLTKLLCGKHFYRLREVMRRNNSGKDHTLAYRPNRTP